MDKLIAHFPHQIKEALQIAQGFLPSIQKEKIKNIVITGMGGSGIGGTFAQEYTYTHSELPIIVNKSYHLPAFVDTHSLVIASSYSGNTEETISCVQDGLQKKAQIIAITSGGQLEKICQEHRLPVVLIPRGFPPRTCLGYSFVQILHILSYMNLTPADWQKDVVSAADHLLQHQDDIKTSARQIAARIHQTFPIIYTLHSEALALRLRQQLNENSKVLCTHHIIPEMNHNELVGWKNLYAPHSVIVLRTDFDLPQNIKRYYFCKNIFMKHKVPVIELKAQGTTILQQWLYLVHLSDWISFELALLNKEDAVEVQVIEALKHQLSQ